MLPKTLRWRIQIWHTLLLSIIVISLLYAFQQNRREIGYQAIDRRLKTLIPQILPALERGGPRGRASRRHAIGDLPPAFGRRGDFPRKEPIPERVRALLGDDVYLINWGPRERLRLTSENAPSPTSSFPKSGDVRTVDGFREAIHLSPRGGALICGVSTAPLEQELRDLSYKLIGIGTAIIVSGFFVGWFLTSRSLLPIKKISASAHRFANGHLGERISLGETTSELGQLSEVIDDTFAKLENSFEQQQRFTADASHEMRTPISVILAKTQFALKKERSPEMYRDSLQSCHDSAQHMRTLVDNLLELARLDTSGKSLHRQRCDLAEIAQESLDFIQPLADKKRITLSADLKSVCVVADAPRIKRVLINLLSNAVKYNHDEGSVLLKLAVRADKAHITVSDRGLGISPEKLPHLFERFYRSDQARTTRTADQEGSTGLGLAIAEAIITSHGGTISVESELGQGSTFSVTLPVS